MVLLLALTSLLGATQAPGDDCAGQHGIVRPAPSQEGSSTAWRSFETTFEEEDDDEKKLRARVIPTPTGRRTSKVWSAALSSAARGASFSDGLAASPSGRFPAVLRVAISLGLSRGPPSPA